MMTDVNIVISEWSYLAAAVLFVLGLRSLSSPATARRGMFLAEIGMALAVVGTLLYTQILTWTYILVGAGVGSAIGALMAG